MSPSSGPTAGGTPITITGTNFVPGATVVIGQGNGTTGAIAATNVVVASSTKITAVTGGEAKAGTFIVYVITSGGTSGANTGANRTYTGAIPTVSAVSPKSGPYKGGTDITVTGTGFVSGSKVEIGQGSGAGPTAIAATNVTVVSPTKITAVTGGGAKAGTFSVYVITSVAMASQRRSHFTYRQPPTRSSLSSQQHLRSEAHHHHHHRIQLRHRRQGGDRKGNGTTGAIAATNVVVASSTKITATTGGGAKAGAFSLFVTTSGGTSAGNSVTCSPTRRTQASSGKAVGQVHRHVMYGHGNRA